MSLLDLVLFLPLIGFLLMIFTPKGNENLPRMMALAISLLIFVISLGLVGPFLGSTIPEGYQFVTDASWISSPPIRDRKSTRLNSSH